MGGYEGGGLGMLQFATRHLDGRMQHCHTAAADGPVRVPRSLAHGMALNR